MTGESAQLVNQFGGEHHSNTARFERRDFFSKRGNRFGMRMPNGNG
jgi:hypothetical protein